MKIRKFYQEMRQGGKRLKPFLCVDCRIDRRSAVAGKEARLELSNPIVVLQKGVGGLTRQTVLERAFDELPVVKQAKLPGLSTKRSDEREGCGDAVEKE